jgi:Peptidase M15
MIFAAFLLAMAGQADKPPPPVLNPYGQWQPNVAYVIIGQDEAGYRAWYLADPRRAAQVKGLNDYLAAYRVGGIIPTWQLLRTASDWQKCGENAFEVPPPEYWPNLVQALRFIHEQVVPAVGPVEVVSGYRNLTLNQCAGGARESAHRYYQAVDMVPLRPTTREILIRDLCSAHARRGGPYGVGLGFYVGVRFHVDTRKYRSWGAEGPGSEACYTEPPAAQPQVASPASATAR